MGSSSVRAKRAQRFIHPTIVLPNDHPVVRLTDRAREVLIERYRAPDDSTPMPMSAQDEHDQFERGHSYEFRTRRLIQLFDEVAPGDLQPDEAFIEEGEITFLSEGAHHFDDDVSLLPAW